MVDFQKLGLEHDRGALIIEEVHPNCVDVFFQPSKELLSQVPQNTADRNKEKVKILTVSGQDDFIAICPVNTIPYSCNFLNPKYENISSIILSGFGYHTPEDVDGVLAILNNLPLGFVRDYGYGLGLKKEYRYIIDAVDDLSGCQCVDLVIAMSVETGIDSDSPSIFNLAYCDYEEARKSVDRITDRSQKVSSSLKYTNVFNLLAIKLGRNERPVSIRGNALTKLLVKANENEDFLTESDQDVIIESLSSNAKSIVESKPEKLAKLQSDIELVTLEALIQKYDVMLDKNLAESEWQAFFNENPFILSMAFGYPVIKVKDQASIGGRKLSGSGEKITDFLVKNSLTNNTAMFEIKTPKSSLLNKTPYREGVFTPSPELSGAINQALDQKYQFQKQISQIKDASRIYDIESYAVHSCLIIGRTPEELDRQKSFELFRRNSKDVQVVTFDELLEKLRQLHEFLRSG